MMTSRSDFDRFGFRVDEIYPFLERHGLTLPRGDGTVSPPLAATEPKFPEWKRVMAALPALTTYEIGHAFAGIDPHEPGYRSDDENAEIYRYQSLIARSILSEEIDIEEWIEAVVTKRDNRGNPTEWEIKPAVLAALCDRKGLPYPLPRPVSAPATNTEALAEIARLKAANARLLAELQEAKDGVIHADHPQYASELDACLTIWRAASQRWKPEDGKTPKAVVEEVIKELFPSVGTKEFDRYSAVCNWDKTPGRKSTKSE
jgi:hypothetical protein